MAAQRFVCERCCTRERCAFLPSLLPPHDRSYEAGGGDGDEYECTVSLLGRSVDTRLPEHKNIESVTFYSPWESETCALREHRTSPKNAQKGNLVVNHKGKFALLNAQNCLRTKESFNFVSFNGARIALST